MKHLSIILIFLTISCGNSSKVSSGNNGNAKTQAQWISDGFRPAMVKDFSSLDGCGYLVVLEEDSTTITLLPINLAEEFQKDTLNIWIKYHSTKPKPTTCMKGSPVVIDDIRLRN